MIAFRKTYSNLPSRLIFPKHPLISQIAVTTVFPLIAGSSVTALESSVCVATIVLLTVMESLTRFVSTCAIPRCAKKLLRNCLNVIGKLSPAYQAFTSVLIMSYIASYAVICRFVRSAVGTSDATLKTPYGIGFSLSPSIVSSIEIVFPIMLPAVFRAVNFTQFASHAPNFNSDSEQRLSSSANVPISSIELSIF